MKVVSAREMAHIEATCGIPGIELMEHAAAAGVRAAERMLGSLANKRIAIVAGRGNNGGDGFAMARLLRHHGANVRVMMSCAPTELKGDALTNFERVGSDAHDTRAWDAYEWDLIVDALLGTGAKARPLDDITRGLIASINASHAPVLAIDIPSGVHADTGQLIDPSAAAVKAKVTVTFGRAKPGLSIYPGAAMAGEITIDPIGIPDSLFESAPGESALPSDIARLLPHRGPLAHKGQSRVLIVGGSQGMAGAVLLAAQAAFKIGAGYVYVSMPEGANDMGWPVEAVRRPLPAQNLRFNASAEAALFWLADSADTIVYGGGFGLGDVERGIVAHINRFMPIPAVIDADALRQTSIVDIAESKGPRVLTPHPGEFSALFGGSIIENEASRIEVTLRAAEKCGHVVVHKGRPTIIAAPDGRYAINPTGNQLLATCGTGDVLAGAIGGLLAQKLPPYDAAVAATWLHGRTAELWPHPVGLTAREVAELLPAAWGAAVS